MSKQHQITRRLGGSLVAIALAAAPAMGASGASAVGSNAGTTLAVAAGAAGATATAKRGHGYRYRHRGYGGHYRGYYGYRHYGYYGFPLYYGYGHYRYGRHHLPRYRVSNVEQLGALDFDIKPKEGEVFLDGRSIGRVKQFDGFPDYLWLEEGTYDVAVFLEGYKTFERTYRIYPGLVIDVDGRMVEGPSTRPEPVAAQAAPTASAPPVATPVDPGPAGGVKGRLLVSVWPSDAAVYLDGHFLGVAEELGHVSAGLLVAAGSHTIEVARPGYRGVTREVEIEAGERFELSVELTER